MIRQPVPFYITGGTLPRDAPSYIERQADADLLEGLRQGQFCYILTSRQMGKSSLMVRTAARLREEGVAVAVLDLTAVGQNLAPDQWYDGLLNLLARALDLEDEMEDFWFAHERLSPLQRWMLGLEKVVLQKIPGPVVLFVDEIDAVRSLPFSADEFFAAIRECYNRRVEDPNFQRLSFCLLGVASPSDLIRDTRNTPFNIGRRIELTDFTLKEAAPLAAGMIRGGEAASLPSSDPAAQHLLSLVLFWTGGHPYLTQRLCQAVAEALLKDDPRTPDGEIVDRLCETLFLAAGARERDDNLIFVRERLLRSEADLAGLLDLYGKVLRGRPVQDDETKPLVSIVKLSGVVRARAGFLAVRNRIYERVFDKAWIAENMPDAELRRQKTAYRRGVLRATSGAAILLVLLGGLIGMGLMSRRALQDAAAARQMAALREASRQQAVQEAQQASDLARSEKAIAALSQQAEKRERSLRRQAEEARTHAEQERERTFAQQQIAQEREAEANRQRMRAERLEGQLQQRSYLDQARALRTSDQIGQRFASLAALAKAAPLHPSPAMRLQLRNEAISDMSVPVDLQVEKHWSGLQRFPIIDVDSERGRYFRLASHGDIQIRRIADDRLLKTLSGSGVSYWIMGHRSPDGRYITLTRMDRTFVVWDCLRGKLFLTLSGNGLQEQSADFSADGRWAAVGFPDGSIRLLTLPARREIKRFQPALAPGNLRLSPDGRLLAVGNYRTTGVQVLDLEHGGAFAIPTPHGTNDLAWQPDGHMLAIGCRDHNIYLIDPQTHQTVFTLEGHSNEPNHIAFNADGTLLASSSWDGTLRLWDPRTGKPLLVNPVLASDLLHFSRDGRRLVGGSNAGCWLWKVAGNQEYRLLNARRTHTHAGSVDFSPDGRLLASADEEGVQLWDVAQARPLARLHVGDCTQTAFSRDGARLITSGDNEFYSWPVTGDRKADTLRIGPPQNLATWTPIGAGDFCQSRNGRILAAIHQESHAHVLTADRLDPVVLKSQNYRMHFIAISPDGRWIATSPWQGPSQVKIWEARTGKLAQERPAPFFTRLTFSPDGRWLVGGGADYRFWEAGTWRPGPVLPRSPGSNPPAPLDFTRDGKLLAIAPSATQVRLVDTATMQEIASLEAPGASVVLWLCFSPDGSKLAVVWEDGRIGLWDLRRIRQRLATLGLDWNLPPYAPPSQETETGAPRVEVIAGDVTAQQYRDQIADAIAQIKAHPNDVDSLNGLAWLYVSAPEGVRNPAKALPLIRKSLQLKPGEASHLNTLGIVYYRLGQYAQALGPLNDSLKAGSDGGDAYNLFFLAMSYAKLGDPAKARDCYDQAVRWVDAHPKISSTWKTELQSFQAEAQALLSRR
ncbi:MAG TPA: AAA-like domain-containing protein [Chthonomonadaceae bacterium]|nr:AAA-like domain-containing protein [Chthonomonadaceae bacterium]